MVKMSCCCVLIALVGQDQDYVVGTLADMWQSKREKIHYVTCFDTWVGKVLGHRGFRRLFIYTTTGQAHIFRKIT